LSPALEKLATRLRASISDGDEFSVLYDLCKKFGSEKRKADLGKTEPEKVVHRKAKKVDPGSSTPNQIDSDEIKALRKALAKAEKRIAGFEIKQNEFHQYVLESLNGWSESIILTLSKLNHHLLEHDEAIRNLGTVQGLNDVGPQAEISIPRAFSDQAA
jgi:hypothetical protein